MIDSGPPDVANLATSGGLDAGGSCGTGTAGVGLTHWFGGNRSGMMGA